MRWIFIIALLTGDQMSHAATVVFVSMAPEQKIQSFKLNEASGELTPVEMYSVDGTPGSLCCDPQRKTLFASLRSTNKLAAYRIDQSTCRLSAINSVPLSEGANAAFVGTDRSGIWLMSASYAAGTVAVHRIAEGGRIETPAVQTIVTAKTAHCIALSRDNTRVLIPHVSPNLIYLFRLDGNNGRLSEEQRIPGGTENAGPRHLVFHSRLDIAYTSDEQGNSVTVYQATSSGMAAVQTLSTLPEEFHGKNSTAEIKVHPSGRFVWVSNRGLDSLAGFSIDADNGRLTAIGQTATEKTPRSFEIDPSGRFIFGAGEGSGRLAVFRVESESGQLQRIHTYELGKSLTWVMAVRTGDD